MTVMATMTGHVVEARELMRRSCDERYAVGPSNVDT
jgi:hypothetical protein